MKKGFKRFISIVLTLAVAFSVNLFNGSFVKRAYAAKQITIYVQKPDNWNSIWIWYDSNLNTPDWDTTALKSSPGDMELYKDNWYKKTVASDKVQFLFNDGTWNNKLTKNGIDFTTTSDIWIKSDGSYTLTDPFLGNVETDSIKVHFYSEWGQSYIYYWNQKPMEDKLAWPGNAMTNEGENWYSYELKNTTSTNIIFNNGNNGKQTEDLTIKKGEWWYKNGEWSNTKPSSPVIDDPKRPGEVNKGSRSDFRDETIYFVITSRFYDGDPSNNCRTSEDDHAKNPESDPSWRGDFKGLIEKLDYIKALGFTAIWITPVVTNKSGYDYHGYHAYDFSTVDKRYESEGATYQDLIDACHAKGIKIIQDVVFNHTCNWGEKNLLQINDDVYTKRN